MRVDVPAVVEDVRIGRIGVHDLREDHLSGVDGGLHGHDYLLVVVAALDGGDGVPAVGGSGGVGLVLAVKAGPDGLEGAVVDGGAVVEVGVRVDGVGERLDVAVLLGLEVGDEVRVGRVGAGGGVGDEEVLGHVVGPVGHHLHGVALDGEVVPVGADLAGRQHQGAAILHVVAVLGVVVGLALLGDGQLVKRRGGRGAVLGLHAGGCGIGGRAGVAGTGIRACVGIGGATACGKAQTGEGHAGGLQERPTREIDHCCSPSLHDVCDPRTGHRNDCTAALG